MAEPELEVLARKWLLEEQKKPLYRAGDFLQVGGTIAGIAIALGSLYIDGGPDVTLGGHPILYIPVLFLLTGFVAIGACLIASISMMSEMAQHPHTPVPASLVLIIPSLLLTAGVAFRLLVYIASREPVT